MKVKELISILSEQDPEMEVILQRDSEGNGFSPLCDTALGYYLGDSTYSGDFYDEDYTADECDMNEEDFAEMISIPKSIVLVPVN